MWFVLHLYQEGLVTANDVLDALVRQNEDRIPLGRLAVQLKKMTLKQVARVLAKQADRRESFGRLAVEMGFLSEEELAYLLMVQQDRLPPLAELLVEMGAIDQKIIDAESKRCRQRAVDYEDDEDEHLARSRAALSG